MKFIETAVIQLCIFAAGMVFGHIFFPQITSVYNSVPVLANGVVKDCLSRGGSFLAYNTDMSILDFKGTCTFKATQEDSILNSL